MRSGRGRKTCFLWFIILTLFVLPGRGTGADSNGKEAGPEQAKVTFLQGRAEVLPKGETTWNALKTGSRLAPEDEVRTQEKSRIEIKLPDGSILRFDQRTTFKLKKAFFSPQDGSRDVRVAMAAGKTWANVRKVFGSKKTFEVASANAVAGVRDTIWRMNVALDQSTLIRVYEGTVEVYNPFVKPDYKPEEGGFKAPREVKGPQEVPRPYAEVTKEQWEEIVLTQMMQVLVPAVGKPGKPSSFNLEEDQKEGWVRWNQRRDKGIKP